MQTMTPEQLKEFLDQRNSGMGGTDAAVVAGENPYKSPLDVYREKLGLTGERPEMSEPMRLGLYMEPYLLTRAKELIEDRTGGEQTVIEGGFHRHRVHDFLIGHLDGLTVTNGNGNKPIGVIECKTASPYMRSKWGDEWTDQIPAHYLIQVQHYLGVTDLPHAYVAVLFGNSEFVIYSVARSDALVDQLFNMEINFWQNHVLKQEPPPIDGSQAAAQLLKQLYPADTGETVRATPEIEVEILQYKNDFQAFKRLEKTLLGHSNLLQDFMKEAAILEFADGKITWKKSKDGQKIDYKKVIGQALEILPAYSKAILNQAIVDHTKPTEGSRRWNVPRDWHKIDESEEE